MSDRFANLTDSDWLQIEQAAKGCIDGTSDDWPALRRAIEKITGKPFGMRRVASWLQGFCQGIMIQSGRSEPSEWIEAYLNRHDQS